MALWNFKSKDKSEAADSVAILAERDGVPVVSEAAVTAKPSVAASQIGAGTCVRGSIQAQGDLNVDGQVIGDVRGAAIFVGENGEVTGDVVGETATIRGRVLGNVRARTIQLAGTGSIVGDLSHAVLIIEEGGVFEGRSKRSPDPLNELALTSPKAEDLAEKAEAGATAQETSEPEAEASETAPVAEDVSPAPEAQKDKEPSEVKADIEEPGKHLSDPPRSAVADVLGDQFAAAD